MATPGSHPYERAQVAGRTCRKDPVSTSRPVPTALVLLGLAVGGASVASTPAVAAPASCKAPAKAVTTAQKKLKKAKTTKAKAAARKRLKAARSAKKACDAKAKPAPTPAPAPVAPAAPAAPAPVPAPAPAPVPQAPIAISPAAPRVTDAFSVATAARSAAPAGYHYRLYVLKRDSIRTSSCAYFGIADLAATGEAAATSFSPAGARLPIGGASIWCGGEWAASLNLVPDTSSGSGDVGQVVEHLSFTIGF